MFQVSSTIEQVKSMADNTWQLKISTQELQPDQVAQIAMLKGKLGWFLFDENTLDMGNVPKEPAPEFKKDKSPSQRLRNTLYVYWSNCTNQTKTFQNFYDEWVEKKITEIKDYLPEK